MEWIPAFKIGLWNAWIMMLYYPLHPLILIVVDKMIGTGEIFKKMGNEQDEQGQKNANSIYYAILVSLLVYSIFLPLRTGTAWFYTGLAIYLIGLLMFLASIASVAITPQGQLFTRGIYRYSRHPLYLSMLMTFTGAGIACASWVYLILTIGLIFLQANQVEAEEQGCLRTFGDEYQAYMNKTPKWIGVPNQG